MVFRAFRRRFQRDQRRNNRQSAFGGTVKSVAEVEALSSKIEQQEAAEFEAFEKIFDADLRSI